LIASIRQNTGRYAGALNVLAIVVLVSAILPLITHPPKSDSPTEVRRAA
jgi:hypothetical protein